MSQSSVFARRPLQKNQYLTLSSLKIKKKLHKQSCKHKGEIRPGSCSSIFGNGVFGFADGANIEYFVRFPYMAAEKIKTSAFGNGVEC